MHIKSLLFAFPCDKLHCDCQSTYEKYEEGKRKDKKEKKKKQVAVAIFFLERKKNNNLNATYLEAQCLISYKLYIFLY